MQRQGSILFSNARPRRYQDTPVVQWNPTVTVHDPQTQSHSYVRIEVPLKVSRPRSTDLLIRYAPQPDASGALFQGWLDKFEDGPPISWTPYWVTLQGDKLIFYKNQTVSGSLSAKIWPFPGEVTDLFYSEFRKTKQTLNYN
jgi:hypothetical protein